MHSFHRNSRTTNTKRKPHASPIPRTLRPETLLVSRDRVRGSENFSSANDEDAPENSDESDHEISDNFEEEYEGESAQEEELSDEERETNASRERTELLRILDIKGKTTQEPKNGGKKSEESAKTDEPSRETRIDEAPASGLIRPFRQKLSTTISDDRSCGSQYEQFALYLKALTHTTTKKPQLEQLAQSDTLDNFFDLGSDQPFSFSEPVAQAGGSNHALQDYQMQLMLLEQQNKKRLMMARQSQDEDDELLAVQRAQHNAKMPVQERQVPGGSKTVDTKHPRQNMSEDLMGSIADALGIPSEAAVSLNTLRAYISDLQQHAPIKSDRYQIIHRTGLGDAQRLYLDRPQWLQGENTSQRVIAGNLPVSNLASYLSKHMEICFIVFRDYDATSGGDRHANDIQPDVEAMPEHIAESVRLIKTSLIDAFNRFLARSGFNTKEKARDGSITLEAPYFAVYQQGQHRAEEYAANLAVEHQSEFQALVDYIVNQYSQEWDEVARLIKRGKITPRYIRYLFRFGDLVVQENEQGIRGFFTTSWLEGPQDVTETQSRQSRQNRLKSGKTQKTREYHIYASLWAFDGVFSYSQARLPLKIQHDDDCELDIAGLELRPLAHSAAGVQNRLRNRGLMFWKCRLRKFVSYHEDPERTSHHFGDDRYMIDTLMYQELRKRQSETMNNQALMATGSDDLGQDFMKHDEPPSFEDVPGFLYMMPMTIKGFNLKSKKWLDLKVDNIGEVVWNDEAFQSLVLKAKTKDLIQALISNQIEAEKSTDLISGKGNGLIMLLHGGPGTGKTLTAESVAEIARKPLYPVTCGDIGTEADQVEDYLESVLHIGKTWGCVVLMDEADVFLQERNLKDLQRNALVSVFLRTLEYYDGILVLTSNRVGHFDAAFRSRIQLAIRYQTLDENQRTQIWGSFIRRLQTFNEGDIDISDLMDHIPELAKNKMNGREIRNAITTARQFAKWKRQLHGSQHRQLDFAMMQEIINISGEFDKYLEEELYEGNSLEQLARERMDH